MRHREMGFAPLPHTPPIALQSPKLTPGAGHLYQSPALPLRCVELRALQVQFALSLKKERISLVGTAPAIPPHPQKGHCVLPDHRLRDALLPAKPLLGFYWEGFPH